MADLGGGFPGVPWNPLRAGPSTDDRLMELPSLAKETATVAHLSMS